MKVLTTTVARFMFAIPMGVFGLFHLMGGKGMADAVIPGWPLNTVIVYLTGLFLIAAAVAIAIKKMDRMAALALGAFLLGTALLIHLMGMMGAADQAAQQMSMGNLLKDVALAGAAFAYAGLAESEGRQ